MSLASGPQYQLWRFGQVSALIAGTGRFTQRKIACPSEHRCARPVCLYWFCRHLDCL